MPTKHKTTHTPDIVIVIALAGVAVGVLTILRRVLA